MGLIAKDVDALVEQINEDMLNQRFVDIFTNQQYQYFVFDEFGTISLPSQQKFKALITNTYFNKNIFIFSTTVPLHKGVKGRCKEINFLNADAKLYLPILTKYCPNVANQNFALLKKVIDMHKEDIRKMVRFCETL